MLVTGPPAAGKTTLARPLADALGLPLIGKDLIKEALFDALGTGDRAWSRRLGVASYEVLYAIAGVLPAAVLDANLGPQAGPRLRALDADLVEVFCRCPAGEVERRFAARAPARHPGHVDHLLGPEMKAALVRGVEPLRLGGPVLEVDAARPLDVPGIATWVRPHLRSARPPTRPGGGAAGGQDPGVGPV